MAPKKKNNKKNDDWESELGETIDPIAAATQAAKDAEAANEVDPEEEFGGGGGLMATMKKNRKKLKAKGKLVEDDDSTPATPPPAEEPVEDIAAKAPEEASIEDEFALPDKKNKGKGGNAKTAVKEDEDNDATQDEPTTGKILTKAQKEKLKKEQEKQRKKEQVCGL